MNTNNSHINDLLETKPNKDYIRPDLSSNYYVNEKGKLGSKYDNNLNSGYLIIKELLRQSSIAEKKYSGNPDTLKIVDNFALLENIERRIGYEEKRPSIYKGAIILSR